MNKRNRKNVFLTIFLFVILLQSTAFPVIAAAVDCLTFQNPLDVDDTPAGVPLQPGKVVNINTWNSTIGGFDEACDCLPNSEPEPMLPILDNWTIHEDIPSLIVFGTPMDGRIPHDYTFFANGSFLARDGLNNLLGWEALTGLPEGELKTSLVANSSHAVQNYLVESYGTVMANVSVIYSVLYSHCLPAGLKITIEGRSNWGLASSGRVGLRLNTVPTSVSSESMWSSSGLDAALAAATEFEAEYAASAEGMPGDALEANTTANVTLAYALGFDWSDSIPSYTSAFDADENALEWRVPHEFSIDPEIIATSADAYTTAYGPQVKTVSTAGRIWAFFLNTSSSSLVFTSTDDLGNSWATPTSQTVNYATVSNGTELSVTSQGGYIYEVVTYANDRRFQLGVGLPSGDGTIYWAYWNDRVDPSGSRPSRRFFPSIYADTDANVYTSFLEPSNRIKVYMGIPPSYSTGDYNAIYEVAVGSMQYHSQLLGDGANSIVLLYGSGGVGGSAGYIYAVSSANGGTTWSSPVATSSTYNFTNSQAVLADGVVYVAAVGSSGASLLKYDVSAGSWSDPLLLDGTATFASISTNGDSALSAFTGNSTSVLYRVSLDMGASWSSPSVISSSETNAAFITMGPAFMNTFAFSLWTSGSSSPYSVKFAAMPATIPTAATSDASWSQPGLSPYEYYFLHESEFVSPGNGLLGVRQTDSSLAGRGLDLAVTRVYSTPYAFAPDGPYQYDNYTAADMGLGWSLNLPWFGQNYFHLWDGQVYSYMWDGEVFENHKGTNFRLVNNSGESFDLYPASGTNYHFDSSKRLVSITDTTGNNTIVIDYNANGTIAGMVDTAGRTVSFFYNENGRLSILATGAGDWTYGYVGLNLVSVTDPLGRTTQYEYETGSNDWLISRVVYPTGAYTNYTYDDALVGTECTTYYTTLQNIYASATELVKSTNFSYTIVNGQFQWCNTTVSDGYSIKGHTLFDFADPAEPSIMDQDQDGNTIRIQRQSFDSEGRINATGLYSYADTLLATSTTEYDNWGNAIHNVDYNGHSSWYSYSNTDTSGEFPGADQSNFTESFYGSEIDGNIHNLLLGMAELQDGDGSARMETYYSYDASGLLLQTKQLHEGSWIVSNFTYDQYGNLATATDALGRTTYYGYSAEYNYTSLTSTTAIEGSTNITTSYTYNFTNGAKLTATDPMGNTTSYAYDDAGRLVCVVYPEVEGVAASKTYAYNDTGNYMISTDENGGAVKQVFDGLGRQVQIVKYNGSEVYSTENFTYNHFDKVSTHTLPSGSTYSFSYDSLGRLTNTLNPDGSWVNSSYDYVRNVGMVIDTKGVNSPSNPWWDENFAYRVPITIAGSSSADATGYQVQITIINGTGESSGGTLYLDKMRVDFGDIRFVSADGSETFNYWVQSLNAGTNATFWFEVEDTIPMGENYTLYIYYGDPTAASASNGTATFHLFDDFEDGTIDTSKWSTSTNTKVSVNETGGELQIVGITSLAGVVGGMRSTAAYQYGTGYAVMALVGFEHTGTINFNSRTGFVPATNWNGGQDYAASSPQAPSTSTHYVYGGEDKQWSQSKYTSLYQHEVTYNILWGEEYLMQWLRGSGKSAFTIDGQEHGSTTASANIPTDTRAVGCQIWVGANAGEGEIDIDWIAVRGYIDPEPAVASYGSEEARGAYTAYGYDLMGQLLWVRQYYSAEPASYYQSDYAYDEVGNLLTVTDANSNTTAYQYDDLNRLVLTSYPDETSQSMAYDSLGNVVGKTDPMGRSINYTYDSLNRLSQVLYPDDSTVDYSYDANGNTLSVVESETSTYYAYDARNRLTNETDVIDGESYSTLYSYDQAGNVMSITYPDETVVSYAYDALGRVSSVEGYASFTYTLTGRIDTIYFENDAVTAYTYDSRGRPTRILTCSGETTLLDLNYTFDAMGNVLTINDEEYAYDLLNRLTYGSGPWGTYNYTYDPAGNLLELDQNGDSTDFTYASCNRLTAMGDFGFTYDDNGNMLTKADGVEAWEYGYDFENRLANVTKDSQLVQTNLYSSGGRRVMATNNSSSIAYTYKGFSILYERNLTSGAEVDRIYAQGLMIAKLSNDVAHYYHQDALGSVRLVTNPSVDITFGSNYVPFGSSVNTTGTEAFMYTGKPVDDVTGLYYFGARFYDPSIFRFITQDRNVGQIGDPISMNRYIYARDNPLAFKDPDGNDPISDWWGGLSSQQQAWAVTGVTILIAAAVCIATVFIPALLPLAKSAITATISATMYTVFSGEKATAVGATIAASSGAVTGGVAGYMGMATMAEPALAVTNKLVVATVSVEVNVASQALQDVAMGKEIDFNLLSVGIAAVAPLVPLPTPSTTLEIAYNELLPSVTSSLIANNADAISNLVTDFVSAPGGVSPYEPDWSTINIIF